MPLDSLNSAEQRFREAFERLKSNKPTLLDAKTPVSQNNVAKEAGCDPSALRKSRYPSLVREIQAYVEIHGDDNPSSRQVLKRQRDLHREFKVRIEELVAQRDLAQAQLVSATKRIVDLTDELNAAKSQLEMLRANNISPLK